MSYATDPDKINMPWFQSPFYESLLATLDLEPSFRDAVQAYARDGYLIFDPEIPDAGRVFERILHDLAGRYQGQGRIQDAWTFQEDVRALAVHAKVLSFLKQLYRREPIPFQTLNFSQGTQQRAHSDTLHFATIPEGFMCGVWIALEDVDEANGPLIVYPGSHRLPVYTYLDMNLSVPPAHDAGNYLRYEDFLQEVIRAKNLPEKKICLKKGQAVLWASNILHGGSPILDPERSRHSQATHYFFSGCLYYTPMRSEPPIGKMFIREVRHIADGKPVAHYYKGEKVRVRPNNRGVIYRGKQGLKQLVQFMTHRQNNGSYSS